MVGMVFAAAGIYLAGWLVASWCFAGIRGPVPVPGRWRRDLRDGLLWPLWLALYGMFWLIGLRRQAFESELPGE
ncbi:MAG: hypothetical protein P8Y58_07920 [Novosphingobium sp.]